MIEISDLPEGSPRKSAELFLATAASVDETGISLVLPGQSAATQKKYKKLLTGSSVSADDIVLCARISGTLIVLGAVGAS